MKPSVPRSLVRFVTARAGGACEYCRLPQVWQDAAFHIDHIRPIADGGPTRAANLALACVTCSLKKGARRAFPDPFDGTLVRVFHPRTDRWREHFVWRRDWRIGGLTATGRATAAGLDFNRFRAVALRRLFATLWEFPPP